LLDAKKALVAFGLPVIISAFEQMLQVVRYCQAVILCVPTTIPFHARSFAT
jgi:hypothetical protein